MSGFCDIYIAEIKAHVEPLTNATDEETHKLPIRMARLAILVMLQYVGNAVVIIIMFVRG